MSPAGSFVVAESKVYCRAIKLAPYTVIPYSASSDSWHWSFPLRYSPQQQTGFLSAWVTGIMQTCKQINPITSRANFRMTLLFLTPHFMWLLTYGFCQQQIMISIGFYVEGLMFSFLEVKQLSLSDYRRSGPPAPSPFPSGKNPFWLLFSNKQTGLIISHACKHCLHTNSGFELHCGNLTQQMKHEHTEWNAGASVGVSNGIQNSFSVKLNYCNRPSCVVFCSCVCWVNCELFRTQFIITVALFAN